MWSVDLLRRRIRHEQMAQMAQMEQADRGRMQGAPTIVRRSLAGAQFVVSCCDVAAARGVVPGMSVAHARALLRPREAERLLLAEHDPHRDLAALRRLAHWAMRCTPIVALDDSLEAIDASESAAGDPRRSAAGSARRSAAGDAGLWLDVTGCRRLFRGEERLLAQLLRELSAKGIRARAAIAPTFGAAWALARFGTAPAAVVDEAGDLAEVLAPLPVAALRLSREQVEALADLDVRRIGELHRLPRTQLALRFGPALLRRMDQALGAAFETIVPIRPVSPPRAERTFEGAVHDQAALIHCAELLLAEVAAAMRHASIGARRLVVDLRRVDAAALRIALELAHPTHRVGHLRTLLRPRLEAVDMGFGIEHVAIEAQRTARLRTGATPPLDGGGAIEAAAIGMEGDRGAARQEALEGELVDLLVARLGAEAVLTPHLVDAHLPERAVELRSALHGAASGARGRARVRGHGDGRSSAIEIARPTILFERPEQVLVEEMAREMTLEMASQEAEAGSPRPPRRLRWRGAVVEIVSASGPERLRGPWWEEQRRFGGSTGSAGPDERDYWRVVGACGCALWLCLRRRGGGVRWCVHGVWT